ncbi:MAG: hypothetical protein ACR2PL_24570 [Dehalococcoidia bacterium]
MMQVPDNRRDLLRQLCSLGQRVQTLAEQMEGRDRMDTQQLEDLQAAVAELTDTANDLEQYVNTGGPEPAT